MGVSHEMGAAARKRVEDHFADDMIAARIRNLFESVVAARPVSEQSP